MLARASEEDFKQAISDLGFYVRRSLRRARGVHPDRPHGQGPPPGVPRASPVGLEEAPWRP
eukprot:4974775-Alexandrium_andersonii.AAC.1